MTLLETNVGSGSIPKRRGKVRDVYDLGNRLLLVATDRISAFDWVLPNGIPDKGRVLTGLSAFWFGRLKVANHLVSTDIDDAGLDLAADERESLIGRSTLVRRARVVPFECVVRGYLSGSAWILADTKFEWGFDDETGELLLVDEVLTPDSSRYWPLEPYRPGGPQPSFDKQFVRDWLEASGWDKASPPPRLPDDVVHKTRGKYVEAFEKLTGKPFPGK
jgi:phosphoribosylaminoimidazole-succinocarboxamide synthase